jgi:hypothetical protein
LSGSNRLFQYQSDGGQLYSLLLAEHVAAGTVQSLAGSTRICGDRTSAHPPLPIGLVPRFIYAHYYSATDGSGVSTKISKIRQRKFIIGTPGAFDLLRGELPSIALLSYPGYPKSEFYVPSKLVGEVSIVRPRTDDPYYLNL